MDKKVKVIIKIPNGSGGRTGWAKIITGADDSKKGGFALLGEFLSEGESLLPQGAVLAFCHPSGSARHPQKYINFSTVRADGSLEEDVSGFDSLQESVSMVERAQELLGTQSRADANPLAGFTDDEIQAEYLRRFSSP